MSVIQYNLDHYHFKTRDEFFQVMTDEMKNVRQSFFKLGMYLTEAYQRCLNNGTGYDDFFEWCDDIFGLQKSSVYNMMRVYNVFRDHKRTDVGVIDERYSKFSLSQLVELLPAADHLEEVSFVKPSDSVATIRKVVKVHKKMRSRCHVECNSSSEYVGRFGAVLLPGDTCIKKQLKGADAFNAVYTALNNEFDIDGWTARDISKRIVYEILGL